MTSTGSLFRVDKTQTESSEETLKSRVKRVRGWELMLQVLNMGKGCTLEAEHCNLTAVKLGGRVGRFIPMQAAEVQKIALEVLELTRGLMVSEGGRLLQLEDVRGKSRRWRRR